MRLRSIVKSSSSGTPFQLQSFHNLKQISNTISYLRTSYNRRKRHSADIMSEWIIKEHVELQKQNHEALLKFHTSQTSSSVCEVAVSGFRLAFLPLSIKKSNHYIVGHAVV
jgi:hypothetical protein